MDHRTASSIQKNEDINFSITGKDVVELYKYKNIPFICRNLIDYSDNLDLDNSAYEFKIFCHRINFMHATISYVEAFRTNLFNSSVITGDLTPRVIDLAEYQKQLTRRVQLYQKHLSTISKFNFIFIYEHDIELMYNLTSYSNNKTAYKKINPTKEKTISNYNQLEEITQTFSRPINEINSHILELYHNKKNNINNLTIRKW